MPNPRARTDIMARLVAGSNQMVGEGGYCGHHADNYPMDFRAFPLRH